MPNANKTHDDLIADWQENAKDHDDQNYRFLRSLKMRSPKKVDRIALELHQEAFSIVDCTTCANCCRTLHPIFTDEDIGRIARHLKMAQEEFIAAYLDETTRRAAIASRRLPARSLATTTSARFTTCGQRSAGATHSPTSRISPS